MFFFLSKLLDVLLAPLTWAELFIIAGALVLWRRPTRRRLGFGLIATALLVLYVFSQGNVSNHLARSLEDTPSTVHPGVTYDAVVLMGGVVQVYADQPDHLRSFNDNVERLLATYDLLRRDQARFAILSGGHTDQWRPEAQEAPTLRDQLIDWGIDPSRIIIDPFARNTHENAVNVKKIAEEHGWKSLVMITSAFHMRRALECFNAEGLPVDTLVVDRRTAEPGRVPMQWLPRAEALAESTAALREGFGRWVYRFRGYAR